MTPAKQASNLQIQKQIQEPQIRKRLYSKFNSYPNTWIDPKKGTTHPEINKSIWTCRAGAERKRKRGKQWLPSVSTRPRRCNLQKLRVKWNVDDGMFKAQEYLYIYTQTLTSRSSGVADVRDRRQQLIRAVPASCGSHNHQPPLLIYTNVAAKEWATIVATLCSRPREEGRQRETLLDTVTGGVGTPALPFSDFDDSFFKLLPFCCHLFSHIWSTNNNICKFSIFLLHQSVTVYFLKMFNIRHLSLILDSILSNIKILNFILNIRHLQSNIKSYFFVYCSIWEASLF